MKKILSVLLATLMLVMSFSALSVFAAEEGDAATSTAANKFLVDARRISVSGDDLYVLLSVMENPGVQSFTLTIEYDDSVLSLQTITFDENTFPGSVITNPAASSSTGKIVWAGPVSSNNTNDGTLAILGFKIIDSAATSTHIEVTCPDGFCVNNNEDIVPFAFQGGNITLKYSSSFQMITGTVEANVGDEVVVPITFKNNPGVQSFTIEVRYDTTKLQLEKFECVGPLADLNWVNNVVGINSRLVYAGRINADYAANDEAFAALTFKVIGGVEGETISVLSFCDEGMLVDSNETKLECEFVAGGVTIKTPETEPVTEPVTEPTTETEAPADTTDNTVAPPTADAGIAVAAVALAAAAAFISIKKRK